MMTLPDVRSPLTGTTPESIIANRDEDFVAFLLDDLNSRFPGWVGPEDGGPYRDP